MYNNKKKKKKFKSFVFIESYYILFFYPHLVKLVGSYSFNILEVVVQLVHIIYIVSKHSNRKAKLCECCLLYTIAALLNLLFRPEAFNIIYDIII